MDQSSEETEKKKASLRKRLGKVIFWIGFIVVAVSLIPSIATAVGAPSTDYGYVSNFIGVGILLAIVGLFTALFPEGHTEQETWIMKMSPFAGNN